MKNINKFIQEKYLIDNDININNDYSIKSVLDKYNIKYRSNEKSGAYVLTFPRKLKNNLELKLFRSTQKNLNDVMKLILRYVEDNSDFYYKNKSSYSIIAESAKNTNNINVLGNCVYINGFKINKHKSLVPVFTMLFLFDLNHYRIELMQADNVEIEKIVSLILEYMFKNFNC